MKTPMKTPNTNTRTPNWYEDCHYKDFVFVMRVVIMGRHVLALISNKKKIVNTQNGKFIGGRGGCSPHQMWFYAGSESGWFFGFFGGFPGRKPAHGSQPIPEKNTMNNNTSTKMEKYHDILHRKIILFANLISEASLYWA